MKDVPEGGPASEPPAGPDADAAAPDPPQKLIEIVSDPSAIDEADEIFSTEDERAKRLRNDSDEQDIAQRLRYAENAYKLTEAWVGFLILLTIGQWCGKILGYGLSAPEFITVFTTTTAAVFGFWALVGRYLFPDGKGRKRRRDKS
jgi:hypothetical protein